MTATWGIFSVLLAIVWVITIVDLVRRHLGAKRAIAWLLLIVLLPFLGSLVYWALRKPSEDELELAQRLEHGAPHPPGERPRTGV